MPNLLSLTRILSGINQVLKITADDTSATVLFHYGCEMIHGSNTYETNDRLNRLVVEMEIMIAGSSVLLLCLIVMYDYLEITALKYGVLKAIAAQSKEVERALKSLIKTKDDYKILNKDFKKLEKIYLTNLNAYLIQLSDADTNMLRREILKKDNVEL